jgi:hypothetical protein
MTNHVIFIRVQFESFPMTSLFWKKKKKVGLHGLCVRKMLIFFLKNLNDNIELKNHRNMSLLG